MVALFALKSVISPVPLICLQETEKSTNVRACQNISRTTNTPWTPEG